MATQTPYQARKSAGLCVECGRGRAATGRVRCRACLRHESERQLERRLKARGKGACAYCGKPVRVPVACDGCREDQRAEHDEARVTRQRDPAAVAGLAAQTRERQLVEVIAAVALLRRGRWSVVELAAELGQHKRTTYRMISAIRRAGIVVEASREGSYRYYAIPAESLRKVLRLM
jgi:hypothetical protein